MKNDVKVECWELPALKLLLAIISLSGLRALLF